MSLFTLPIALSGKTTTITFPSHSESGQETSTDIFNKAYFYLEKLRIAHPNLVFPTFAYKYVGLVRKISPKTVEMHYLKLVAECEFRILHPESFTRPQAFETLNFAPIKPEEKPAEVAYPITPLNLIFKTPQPTKSVTFENIQLLTSGNTTPIGGRKLHFADELQPLVPFVPIQPQEDKDVPYEVTMNDFMYFMTCNCVLHDVTFEEFQKEWPCVRDANPDDILFAFDTFAREKMRNHLLKKREPECVSPVEEADPSPIRININERDQMAMIEPPCGWQGDFFGPLSYPWIFGGFTLAHLICEMDAGFPFIGRCSDQTLRKLLLDLQGIYELFTTLMSLPVGSDPEGIDTDWTYSSVLCNVSLSEFDDGIGGIGAQVSIFNKCKRRILTKVIIDLDELISAFRLLLTKSSMERLTFVGFTNEEIRDHIHRIQSYQL